MSQAWPFCAAIGCKHAGVDLSGSGKQRRYATDAGNAAQRAVFFMSSFVVGKPDRSICLCTECWQASQNAGKRLREGRLTISEEMACTSVEYVFARCLVHLPLSFFTMILEELKRLMGALERWRHTWTVLSAVLAEAEKSSAEIAHDDSALMVLYAGFLGSVKKHGAKVYTTDPELTSVLFKLHASRRDAIRLLVTTFVTL